MDINSPMIKKAINLAFNAHEGQTDKGGMAYIMHPFYIESKLNEEDEIITALLHDTLEDSNLTKEDLLNEGFSTDIIEAIDTLTKKQDDYFDYIYKVKKNDLARKIKLLDLKHNMDLTRLEKITNKDIKRNERYKKAIEILNGDYK
ncbi:GTP pyrophosphokinase [Anaerofustis stercorihominis]|uniref:GTP pyrophosphokinase n=1 Tax=Anaerofustis stercorihominis TaxID=214853 RepID=UPI00214C499A|nr:GTP pyrophosphokinase [Anaerofustis stercorihominis]MCR2033128.1 GTP pyrophosphokinase [Anaerofustis stercorihominis]